MSLCKYVKEIESLRFQIQFSVVGGIEILQLAMERHPTLVALRSEISNSAESADAAFERIVLLLTRVEAETQLSYDESIAAYLFCLFREKPLTAYRASWRILDHGGLWWSVQLAHHVKEMSRQIFESMDTSDNESETVPVSPPDSESVSVGESIFVVYGSVLDSTLSLWSNDIGIFSAAPNRFIFGNRARTDLASQKTFEISNSPRFQHHVSLLP